MNRDIYKHLSNTFRLKCSNAKKKYNFTKKTKTVSRNRRWSHNCVRHDGQDDDFEFDESDEEFDTVDLRRTKRFRL